MMPVPHPSSSFLVRVVEGDAEGRAQIKVQNLKTGEVHSFKRWETFVTYLRTQPKLGTLK